METLQFEPMSVGRIFDRVFTIYRNNFLRFITIVALIQVPLVLLSTATQSWMSVDLPARQASSGGPASSSPYARQYDAPEPAQLALGCLGTAVTALLQIIGTMLCQAALTKSVSETYLGREITVGQAYGFVLPKWWTLIAATICATLVIYMGLFLCIVPGVIFAMWFFLTVPAIVVENRRAMDGMSRSKNLVAGNLGKVFGVGLLAVLLVWAISFPLGIAGGLVGRMLFTYNPTLRVFTVQLASALGQILVTPIGAGAAILLYYDLRIRKEGFDLQMLAQSMTSEQGELRAS